MKAVLEAMPLSNMKPADEDVILDLDGEVQPHTVYCVLYIVYCALSTVYRVPYPF